MFSGIIETCARISEIIGQQNNLTFKIESSLAGQLHINQSVSHNGICLTVTEISDSSHTVTAVRETITKTAIADWRIGQLINLERCTPADGRFDGHIVQGHVDTIGQCLQINEAGGSWLIDFGFSFDFADLIVEKGSVCIDGVSLTVFDVRKDKFSVAIIPYTWFHTHFNGLKPGMNVNLEFDVIGKYVRRMLDIRGF